MSSNKRYIQNRLTKKMEGSYSIEGRDNIPNSLPNPMSVLPLPSPLEEDSNPNPLYQAFEETLIATRAPLQISSIPLTVADLERSKQIGLEMLQDPMIVSMIRQSPKLILSNPVLAPLVYLLAEQDLAKLSNMDESNRDGAILQEGVIAEPNPLLHSLEELETLEIWPNQNILDAVITEERPTPLPIEHRVLLGYIMETDTDGSQVPRKVYLRVSGEVAVNRPDPNDLKKWKLQEIRPESYLYWEERAINVSKTLWDYWEGKGLHETIQAVPFRKIIAEDDEVSPYIEVLETNGDYVRYYDNPDSPDGSPCLAYLMPVEDMPKLLQQYMKEKASEVWGEYECDPMRVEFNMNRGEAIKNKEDRYSKWDGERPDKVIWISSLDDKGIPVLPI